MRLSGCRTDMLRDEKQSRSIPTEVPARLNSLPLSIVFDCHFVRSYCSNIRRFNHAIT